MKMHMSVLSEHSQCMLDNIFGLFVLGMIQAGDQNRHLPLTTAT